MKVVLRILRGESFEEFELELLENATLVTAFEAIERHPYNREGKAVPPVKWGGHCLEGLCGGCGVYVNGRAVLACETFLSSLPQPIEVRPLRQFPLFQDLWVDLRPLFFLKKELSPWRELPFPPAAFSLPLPKEEVEEWYEMGLCVHCGICTEVCPEVGESFLGPEAILASYLAERQDQYLPGGFPRLFRFHKKGLPGCRGHRECERHCPASLPLSPRRLEGEIAKRGEGDFGI